MRDQTNIIVTVVAVLLGIIGATTLFFTKPEPQPVSPVETVPLAAAKLPAAEPLVVKANALPGGSAAGGGAGGGFGAPGSGFGAPKGAFGAPSGFGGPPGGPPGGFPGAPGGRGGKRGPVGAGG